MWSKSSWGGRGGLKKFNGIEVIAFVVKTLEVLEWAS
jgi:hypothetical protein